MTQPELADNLGEKVTKSWVSDIERGDKNITLSRLSQIAEILKVPLSYLVEPDSNFQEIISILSNKKYSKVKSVIKLFRDLET